MNLKEAIHEAVEKGNIQAAARVADHCRYSWRMNYQETYDFVNEEAPIELSEWDALLYESD